MKYPYFFCLFGLAIITACNNPKNGANGTDASDSTTNVKAELTANFYKRLEGTIAGKKVVMHLQKVDDDDVSGSYYYDGSWLNLSTDTLIGKDSIMLTEYSFYESYFTQNFKSPHLSLKWTGNGFNGSWESGDKSKKYPIVLTEKYPEGSYPFNAGIYKDSIKAFNDQPKSPTAEISFEYLESKNTDEYGSWLNAELKKISGIKAQVDRPIGFKNIATAYFKDYKAQVAEQSKNSRGDDFEAWMNYTNNSQQSISYNDNGYIVIDFLADAYTGGAHGNYSSLMYCLDVKNKKQLLLSDIIKIDSNTLQGILERSVRKEYNIKAKDALSTVLFDDFIKPNNNFYFNANGIAFMYNPYEVASYAQGQIVVFIPYSELKTYLVPSFVQRMGIK